MAESSDVVDSLHSSDIRLEDSVLKTSVQLEILGHCASLACFHLSVMLGLGKLFMCTYLALLKLRPYVAELSISLEPLGLRITMI